MSSQPFAPYTETITYKKRLIGATLEAFGLNPRDESRLEDFFALLPDKKIEIRTDPLLGQFALHSTLISEERAKRPIVAKTKEEAQSGTQTCDFCKPRIYSETAVPKVHHGETDIVSAPNRFPFITPHYVTVFTNDHKPNLNDTTTKEILQYLSSGRELAQEIAEAGCDGMWDGINWGPVAGGSQPHPHAQRGGLYTIMNDLAKQESLALERRRDELEDPFEHYMQLVRDSPLLIHEDEHSVVFAPYAPRFTDQVDIITKRSGGRTISTFLDLGKEATESVAGNMASVFKRLRTERGVKDLNVLTHQARFSDTSGKYRMHWHICPRKSILALMELSNLYIVSTFPEDTGSTLSF